MALPAEARASLDRSNSSRGWRLLHAPCRDVPEIRTMRKALIVDLDHPIRPEPVELLARRSLVQKQQTGMITADPKLSCARERAFALNAVDHDSADVLFAERRAGRHPGYQ